MGRGADRQAGSPDRAALCVLAGDDPKLIGHVAAAVPGGRHGGFVLLAPKGLARLARIPGCKHHIAIEDHPAPGALAAALAGLAQGRSLVGVGADDCGTDLLDALSHEIDLAVLDHGSQSARLQLRDKWQFHLLCGALEIPVPAARCFADKRAIPIDTMLRELGAPLVIKPIDQAGSRGIAVVQDAGDFKTQVLNSAAYDFAPLMVQRFIPGDDIGLSLLAHQGVVRHVCIQVFHGDICHFITHPAYLDAASRLVAATGFSGLAHFDAQRAADGSLHLLECNTRPWASISQANWGGLNFVRAAIDAALGRPPVQREVLSEGTVPLVRDWWRAHFWRPWRLAALTADQRALAIKRPWISRLTPD